MYNHGWFTPRSVNKIKTSIAINGTPVLLAVSVYQSFEGQDVAQSGIIPIPDTDNEQCLGGHESKLFFL